MWDFKKLNAKQRAELVLSYMDGDYKKALGIIVSNEVDNGSLLGCESCNSNVTPTKLQTLHIWMKHAIKNKILT
jgi:hypothetical protein